MRVFLPLTANLKNKSVKLLESAARKYPFSQVDAFTQERLKGNPCAVILEADDLTDAELLAIAREMNLSEPTFVAHQGMHLHRPGTAFVKVYGSRESIQAVEVAGHAITTMAGELFL